MKAYAEQRKVKSKNENKKKKPDNLNKEKLGERKKEGKTKESYSNLTASEKRGLLSLKKRIAAKEIFVA